jgi:hypothetical protein
MATVKKKPAAKKKAVAPKKKPAAKKKSVAKTTKVAPKKKAVAKATKVAAPKKKAAPGRRLADAVAQPIAPIRFDIAPHFARMRSAIGELVGTLHRYGAPVKLGAPASVEAILAAERARGISLPNDYRALLSLHDGMILFDRKFFSTRDYLEDTLLTQSAREYLQSSADWGFEGIEDCIPLANWGQPNDWLLYDPRGRVRGGKPGHVVMLNADECPVKDVCDALAQIGRIAENVLGRA